MTPIELYLDKGMLRTSNLEARKVCATNACYILIDGVLYWRGYLSPLLCYVDAKECNYLLQEIHEGIYETHEAGQYIAHKAL